MNREGTGKWIFRRNRIFWKIFSMVSVISLASVLIFALFINRLMVANQQSRIEELSLSQLRQTSEDIELRLQTIRESMEQDLWSSDLVSLMVNPAGRNSDSNYRVVSALKGYVTGNSLLRQTWLYLPGLDEVYSSGGNYMAREDFAQADLVDLYLSQYARERGDGNETRDVLFYADGHLLLAMDFCVPNCIGVLFFEIDTEMLAEVVRDGYNADNGENVYIYDGSGAQILSGEGVADLGDETDFITVDSSPKGASWYRYESEELGWSFVRSLGNSDVTGGWEQAMGLILTFLLVYLAASQLFSINITRHIYRPISRLMKLTGDRVQLSNTEGIRDEVDYLELVVSDTLEQNNQYRMLMESISRDVMAQMFRNILQGKEMNPGEVENALRGSGNLEMARGRFLVFVCLIVGPDDRDTTAVEAGLYQRSLMNLAEQIPEETFTRYLLMMDQETLAIICCFPEESSALMVKRTVEKMNDYLQKETDKLPYRIVCGNGVTRQELSSLYDSYREAILKARYARYVEDEGMETVSEAEWERKYYEERARQAAEMAEKGSRREAETVTASLIGELVKCPHETQAKYAGLMIDALIEKMIDCGIEISDAFPDGVVHDRDELERLAGTEDLGEHLLEFCRKAIENIQSGSRKNTIRYVSEAKKYIEEHYNDGGLTLNMVSEAIGISAPYLSALFTEVVGDPISTYLNAYRVKQARKFLLETGLSVSEIGFKCGFNSAQSFGRVFKRHTGYTPGRFRDLKKETQE